MSQAVIEFLKWAAFVAVAVGPAAATTWIWLRSRPRDEGPWCGQCGYPIRDFLDRPCPECGSHPRYVHPVTNPRAWLDLPIIFSWTWFFFCVILAIVVLAKS